MTGLAAVRDRVGAAWRRPGVAGGVLAVLAALTLGSWALASPVGAGPDDDFHLVSTWCAEPAVDDRCAEGEGPGTRIVPVPLLEAACFAYDPEESAACQLGTLDWGDVGPGVALEVVETQRGNFGGEYPPVYYSVNGVLTGDDVVASALGMRVLAIALFVGLASALWWLLPITWRPALVWGHVATMVPLGVFLFGTNNPSTWAVVGVPAAFLAALGFLEARGRRRIALGAVTALAVVVAAGARADAAIFAGFALALALLVSARRDRSWMLATLLPIALGLVALAFFLGARQSQSAVGGFSGPMRDALDAGGVDPGVAGSGAEAALSGAALLAYNVLNLPFLWAGAWGQWGLGWLDTSMPAIVTFAGVAVFAALGFVALRGAEPRLRVAAVLTTLVLAAVPLAVLQAGSDPVGEAVQPRYVLPLIVLLGVVLLLRRGDAPGVEARAVVLGRTQRWLLVVAIGGAHFVALHMNLRRYVTGIDEPGPNLDAGLEWWWPGLPVGPTALWLLGSLAFVGVLAIASRLLVPADAPRVQTSAA